MSDSCAARLAQAQAASAVAPYLDSYLLVHTLLLLFYLLLELLDGCSVWRCAICLKDLDVPWQVSVGDVCSVQSDYTNSSVRGVIFFSSISSSAKFFLYFSQFCPVAEGCPVSAGRARLERASIVAHHGSGRWKAMVPKRRNKIKVVLESKSWVRRMKRGHGGR